jgi:PKHD-type hydroxylase
MIITEPRWRSFVVETTGPMFTPKQCNMIIEAGRSEPKRSADISWIPFKKMPEMYKDIEKIMKATNGNHFGFEGMTLTEYAQYTEYPEGGFYDWHVDNDVNCAHEPPVRKISMTCLLSPESEFEGGDLELLSEGKVAKLKQGQAVFFASFIRHRVKPVIRGVRKSLVMWFGGTPFK